MKSLIAHQPVDEGDYDKDESGLYGELIDFNFEFRKLEYPKYIQDVVDPITGTHSLKDALYTTVNSSETVEPIPSCTYGCTRYEENLNTTCGACGTMVEYPSERTLDPTLWIRKSPRIEKFINPYVFSGLKSAFDLGSQKQSYNPFLLAIQNKTADHQEHRAIIAGLGINPQFGYNYIVTNFKSFLTTITKHILDLIDQKVIKATQAKRDELLDVLDLMEFPLRFLISDVLPLRNSLLMVLEESNNSVRSQVTQYYGEAITYVLKIGDSTSNLNKDLANILKFYLKLDNSYLEYVKQGGKKGGGIRTEPVGGRSGFGMRSVITQQVKLQAGDEISLPYTATIIALKPHLIYSYTNDGYSLKDTLDIIEKYTRVFNKDLHDRLTAINGGFMAGAIGALATRYPTLYRWSTTAMLIGEIKKDPDDLTIGLPASILPSQTADFDGDEETIRLIFNRTMLKEIELLSPQYAPLELNEPFKIAANVAGQPKVVTQAWIGYVSVHPAK